MKKKDIVKKISTSLKVNNDRANDILKIILSTITESLYKRGSIDIRNFGKLYVYKRNSRKYYNIHTEKFELSSTKKIVRFRPSKKLLRQSHNKSFQNVIVSFPSTQNGKFPQYPTVIKNPINIDDKPIESKVGKRIEKHIYLNKTSGSILLPNEINIGERGCYNNIKENTDLEIIGHVLNDTYDMPAIESSKYLYIAFPVNGTPILNYKSFSGIVGGISEPLLYHSLLEFENIEPQIKVLQNITLPIKNRNYGYKPDIALVWKEKNIFIDIEIDEPYDIVSRKPIHYLKCRDALRNAYFLDNGWYVFRVAEQQVINDLNGVKNSIFNALCTISNDSRFDRECKCEEISRWSYEDAVNMEKEHFREELLGIEIPLTTPKCDDYNDDEYCTIENFKYNKPDKDIICDRHKNTRKAIRDILKKNKYIVIKSLDEQYEYVPKKENMKFCFKDMAYGIEFYDIIEEKEYFLPFNEISSYYGTDNLYKELTFENNGMNMRDAMINCNPIRISYVNNQGIQSNRKVIYITPWFTDIYKEENKSTYGDLVLLRYGTRLIFYSAAFYDSLMYFSGYCLNKNELRTFSTVHIKSLKIYNVHKPAYIFDVEMIWDYLEEDDGKAAELMYRNLPEKYKNKLIMIGNLCNALVMQGKLDEAINTYISHDLKEPVYKGKTWHDTCIEDINHFVDKSKEKENFKEIKDRLVKRGW